MNPSSDPESQDAPAGDHVFSPPFPVVGLGASAGGIRALQTFFQGLPPENGMAFVVVMHLSPDHESSLAQELQNTTSMPVAQVTEAAHIEADHVYVIPPGRHLALQANRLELTEPQQPAGRRVAIDLFFRTLSASYGPRAIAIVLSGADSDGVIGIKHIKEQGGLTIAQDPAEAEFDGMPRAAIATGVVDWVLPVAQIADRLLALRRHAPQIHLPPEQGPEDEASAQAEAPTGYVDSGPHSVPQIPSVRDGEALAEALLLLRSHTGYDFTHYKRATVLRRIARRMQVNLLEDLPAYLDFLRTHPGEGVDLLHDLLINVTNFFRDREAFARLQRYVPQLFAGKSSKETVRVWVAACATGEEAYSLSILLHEYAANLKNPPAIQIFATDIDLEAIQAARAAIYAPTIEADVSPERLRRCFHVEQRGYRLRKEIRERVLFSLHDVLQDPPFSRLDMVTCRNLLIYLRREAQEQVFDTFHFALKPGGLLFLGSSESLDQEHPLFAPLDRKHLLYVRRAGARPGWQMPTVSSGPPLASRLPLLTRRTAETGTDAGRRDSAIKPFAPYRHSGFGDLHLKMLEPYAPPSLLVNANFDIVHLSGQANRFLHLGGGEPSLNVLKVIHLSLRAELRAALFRANEHGESVTVRRVAVALDTGSIRVDLTVRPSRKGLETEGYFLVLFAPVDSSEHTPIEALPEPGCDGERQAEELRYVREQLTAAVEQYELALEEQRTSNEALQAMNKEMRAAAEELETIKEEIQSVNEELTSRNQELESHMAQLSRANNDLQNLMTSTEIGTLFLDRQMQIKWFTPHVQRLFNILPTDIGRPISDLTPRLEYSMLLEDAKVVLQDLRQIERELPNNGNWFLMRLLPYRTEDDHIDGVVLTFTDITERKRAEEGRLTLAREVTLLTERNRMAQELHDTLAQNFTGIRLQLDSAEGALRADPIKVEAALEHLVCVRDHAQRSQAEAQRVIRTLRSSLMEFRTLGEALEEMARRANSGVQATFTLEGDPLPLSGLVEHDLYRMAQEALTNALQHGGARCIAVTLTYFEGELHVSILDDGRGFDPAAERTGFGLTGMQERAQRIGAELEIQSQPGQGTQVTILYRIRLPENPLPL